MLMLGLFHHKKLDISCFKTPQRSRRMIRNKMGMKKIMRLRKVLIKNKKFHREKLMLMTTRTNSSVGASLPKRLLTQI